MSSRCAESCSSLITTSVKVSAVSNAMRSRTSSARSWSSTMRSTQTSPPPTRDRMSMRWPIDQNPSRPMPYLPATISSWRSRGDSPRLREWPMFVAIARSAASRESSGTIPSPSSRMTSAGARRTRRRSIVTRRAFASSEFCTSSATALRGSLWLRASHRMRSNGSAGLSLSVDVEEEGISRSSGAPHPRRHPTIVLPFRSPSMLD